MTFYEYKSKFIQKHSAKADWHVETSPMREDGSYIKTYIFTDGATLYELNRPIEELVEVETEVRGIKIVVKDWVKLMETECWSTDDAKSVKFYERW